MKLLKKVFSILVVFCLLLGVSVIKPAPARAIHDFWMELSSPRPGANSIYKFHFSLEKTVKVHDWIKLVFPPGTTLEKTPAFPPPSEPPSPCRPCQGFPIINNLADGSIELKFNSHIELDPSKEGYRDIIATVPASISMPDKNGNNWMEHRFHNPTKPGFYIYKIATQSEPELVESRPLKIQDYPLSSPIVQIEPIQLKEKAGYSIDFDLNEFCDMKAGQDSINIQFPKEVVFSKTDEEIHRDWITVNESNLLEWPTIQDNVLTIPIPYDLKSGQHVSIKIDSRLGLVNPEKTGTYELSIRLSNQIDWFRSFPYFVATQPSPLLLIIEPPYCEEEAEFSILQTLERMELNPLDTIYVRFPDAIKLPSVLSNTEILINNQPAFQVTIEGQVVAIRLKSRAKGWMPLEIKFTKQAGITLPRARTAIQLELKLSEEAAYLVSNPVNIY